MAKTLAKPRAANVAKRAGYGLQVRNTAPSTPHDQLYCEERLFELYEQILGLTAPNSEFRHHVSQANTRCVELQFRPLVKDTVVRKGLIRVSKVAKAVTRELRALHSALDDVAPQYGKWLGQDWRGSMLVPARDPKLVVTQDPGRVRNLLADRAAHLNIEPAMLADLAVRFDELSAIANRHANIRKQTVKGGAPKMLAFRALLEGLERAFRNVTGHDAHVTWSHLEGRYEGKFFELVRAVLPLAQGLTKTLGKPLQCPESPLALGKYISEQTRKGKKRSIFYSESM